MSESPLPAAESPNTAPMGADEFTELSDLLDRLREDLDEAPQWEFCEGFMAALICCRRAIEPVEYFAALFDCDDDVNPFPDPAQAARFAELWMRRWNEVLLSLQADVKSMDDERCYQPEVMDMRGLVAELPPEERAAMGDAPVPSFAQIWAIGFMYAVETWPEDWDLPRDKEAAKVIDEALQSIVALTEDDNDPPTVAMMGEGAAPSASEARLGVFGDAIWAVYDLHGVWASLGPRVEPLRKAPEPGRNDPCPCGSGKKYKKCHGA